jgi:elongation factor G
MSNRAEPFIVEIAIAPKSPAGRVQLDSALNRLRRDDGRFALSADPESGQSILKSTSLDALERAMLALKDFEMGAPQVAYRETLTKPVGVKYTHKKQMGGAGQFAEVTINFEPLPTGAGFLFEDTAVGGSIPKEFVPAIENGLRAQKESGLLAGFPVIDFKATLVDGKYHEVDSNALTFDVAARAAFRELAGKSAIKLLEPVMRVEVRTPDIFLGSVIGDLNSRRGQVQATESLGNDVEAVTALVPLSNMFEYSETLPKFTQRLATFSMRFAHYARVPGDSLGDDDPRFPGAMGARVA